MVSYSLLGLYVRLQVWHRCSNLQLGNWTAIRLWVVCPQVGGTYLVGAKLLCYFYQTKCMQQQPQQQFAKSSLIYQMLPKYGCTLVGPGASDLLACEHIWPFVHSHRMTFNHEESKTQVLPPIAFSLQHINIRTWSITSTQRNHFFLYVWSSIQGGMGWDAFMNTTLNSLLDSAILWWIHLIPPDLRS